MEIQITLALGNEVIISNKFVNVNNFFKILLQYLYNIYYFLLKTITFAIP